MIRDMIKFSRFDYYKVNNENLKMYLENYRRNYFPDHKDALFGVLELFDGAYDLYFASPFHSKLTLFYKSDTDLSEFDYIKKESKLFTMDGIECFRAHLDLSKAPASIRDKYRTALKPLAKTMCFKAYLNKIALRLPTPINRSSHSSYLYFLNADNFSSYNIDGLTDSSQLYFSVAKNEFLKDQFIARDEMEQITFGELFDSNFESFFGKKQFG